MGTPGRLCALVRNNTLKLGNVKHFVLDECDKMLDELGKEVLVLCLGLMCLKTCVVMSRRFSARLPMRSKS